MEWTEYKLEDICTATQGVQIPKRMQINEPKVGYRRYLYISDFKSNKKLKFVEDVHSKKIVTDEDIIVSNTGSQGEVYWGIDGILSNNLFKVTINKKLVTSSYLYRFLQSPLFIDFQSTRVLGSTQPHMGHKNFLATPIVLPSIPEQKRIVAILDQAFAEIEQARAKTEQNLKNARELFESYLQKVFSQRGEGWIETTLGELCERMEYGTSSKSQAEGNVPVLRMGNIQRGLLDWEKLVYTSDKADIEKLLLRDDDVLFNRTNSPELVGKTAIYRSERPAIFAGYLIRIHRKEDVLDAGYLNYYLNSNLAREYGYTVMSHSTNQANISGTKLKTYPINIPNLSKQKEFSASFRLLEIEVKKVENIYKNKLALLDNLKKSILQKAFSGELTKEQEGAAA